MRKNRTLIKYHYSENSGYYPNIYDKIKNNNMKFNKRLISMPRPIFPN
jgi:hypothetical protein